MSYSPVGSAYGSPGRSSSPNGDGPPRPGSPRAPPSYSRSSLDRSPMRNPLVLDDRPRVPPPIYLRSSCPLGKSNKGQLRINVPAWGVVLVRPQDRYASMHHSTGTEPPTEDTLVSGYLEVTMKERRRCQAMSVGVQSVCKLDMGGDRGWEIDGIFERGVEILGGDSEGIWLEKGVQTFQFSLLLPATLATHDYHEHARLSHIFTARVEGVPASSGIVSMFAKKMEHRSVTIEGRIPHKEDFEIVIARSDKLAADLASGKRVPSPRSSPVVSPRGLPVMRDQEDDSAIAVGGDEGPASVLGLYHRRQSFDMSRSNSMGTEGDRSSVNYIAANETRTEKTGWLTGDICVQRFMLVHANPSPMGGISQLDLRKEGFVQGIGSWRFSAVAEVFHISAVLGLSFNIPTPLPECTLFFCRLLVTQTYSIVSPRTPNDPPITPESPSKHLIYQVGVPNKSGIRFPDHDIPSLWRGVKAGGQGGPVELGGNGEEGWKVRAVARMPDHAKIRPSTHEGTITPIRVSHDLLIQFFYSVEGQATSGRSIEGPGELRMMQVKVKLMIPSCCNMVNSLVLPDYNCIGPSQPDVDPFFSSTPGERDICACSHSFAELGEATMRRLTLNDQEEAALPLTKQDTGS